MKKFLFIAAFLLLSCIPGRAQNMIPYYNYDLYFVIDTDNDIFRAEYYIQGYTYCSGGCPVNATHYGNINILANDEPGLGGGGGFTHLDPVPAGNNLNCNENLNLALPVWVNFHATGSVTCSIVGTISVSPGTWYSTDHAIENAITFSYATYGTSNLATNATMCSGTSYPPDWPGPTSNPDGKYPSAPEYWESITMGYTTAGQDTGWTWVFPQNETVMVPWPGALEQECTKRSAGDIAFWQAP